MNDICLCHEFHESFPLQMNTFLSFSFSRYRSVWFGCELQIISTVTSLNRFVLNNFFFSLDHGKNWQPTCCDYYYHMDVINYFFFFCDHFLFSGCYKASSWWLIASMGELRNGYLFEYSANNGISLQKIDLCEYYRLNYGQPYKTTFW